MSLTIPRRDLIVYREPLRLFVNLASRVLGGRCLTVAWQDYRRERGERAKRYERPAIALAARLRPLLVRMFGTAPDLWDRMPGKNSVLWLSDEGMQLYTAVKPLLESFEIEARELRD